MFKGTLSDKKQQTMQRLLVNILGQVMIGFLILYEKKLILIDAHFR